MRPVDYALVRSIHVTCAACSIALFAARGAAQFAGVDWRRWRWLRIAPHVNDTVLLGAAIALVLQSHQYPLAQPWLTAKVAALLAYIVIGRAALRPGVFGMPQRIAFFVALAIVGYIAAVAWTRSATPGLA